eukprot:758314-Hanusia_phi.AAC.7
MARGGTITTGITHSEKGLSATEQPGGPDVDRSFESPSLCTSLEISDRPETYGSDCQDPYPLTNMDHPSASKVRCQYPPQDCHPGEDLVNRSDELLLTLGADSAQGDLCHHN